MKVIHNLKPIYNEDSQILILGTIPSIKSREQGFYYSHPKNRFWKVLAKIYQEKIPCTIEEKTNFLIRNNIALWDTLQECNIISSNDSSISNIKVNDISQLLNKTKITKIYTTGKKAFDIYQKEIYPKTNIKAIYLPSTSSANATYTLDKLINEYQIIKKISNHN